MTFDTANLAYLDRTRGNNSRTRKLTEDVAQAILDAESDEEAIEIAIAAGSSRSNAIDIRNRRAWSHLVRTGGPLERQTRTVKGLQLPDTRPECMRKDFNFSDELYRFDHARWSVACREMQVRVLHGNIDHAIDVLRAFARCTCRARASMDSAPITVLPVRDANALESAGYLTLLSIDQASDLELRSIENIGDKCIAVIRSTIARVKAGQVLEGSEEDQFLIDPDCYEERLESLLTLNQHQQPQKIMDTKSDLRPGHVTYLRPGESLPKSNADQVLAALDVLSSSPDTTLEVIDKRLAEIEAEAARLRRLRKTLGGTPAKPARQSAPTGLEPKIFELISQEGSLKVSQVAERLDVHVSSVYYAINNSTRLVKNGTKIDLA